MSTATDIGWLKCDRCGVVRPPKAVAKTPESTACMDRDVCARLQETGKPFTTKGPNDEVSP